MTRPTRKFGLLAVALVFSALLAGCATGPQPRGASWPDVDATPADLPSDLDTQAPTALLRSGSDGFVYIVGLAEKTKPGRRFVARYSGKWPLGDLPRPPLVAGRVVKAFNGRDAARVHLTYRLPNTELAGLEVTWADGSQQAIGKGLVDVTDVKDADPWTVSLGLGGEEGLGEGDVYAILSEPSKRPAASEMQLTRRLVGLCQVPSAEAESATCEGYAMGRDNRAAPRAPKTDDVAVFLEHRIAKPPREAVIKVAKFKGGDGELRDRVIERLRAYVDAQAQPNATVKAVDVTLDATREDFHRVQESLDYDGRPAMVVAGTVKKHDDGRHLVLNYTGIGPAAGPGMVAAPPTGGIDLGAASKLQRPTLDAYGGIVWAGLLVYRGQTDHALTQLYGLLRRPALTGPMRWHARDQFAMRWGAYGHYREALWLVLEDEAVARADNNEAARLNAMGTRVRLYDFVGLGERAVELAKSYLANYQKGADEASRLAALGMYTEMLVQQKDYETARAQLDKLAAACPEGCRGDLFSYLAGIWWATPREAPQSLRERLMEWMVRLAQPKKSHRMAAARLYQGLEFLGDKALDQALIAFKESHRLYKDAKILQGQARTQYFLLMTQIRREESQKAFLAGREALKLRRELRDFEGVARTYTQMAQIYANLRLEKRPGPFLGYAKAAMTGAIQSQHFRGDLKKTSEALFTYGAFLFRFGDEAALQKLKAAVGYAVQSTRFDIAALAHLYMALIGQRQQDKGMFQDHIRKAKVMADLADDPRIDRAIERALNPPKKRDKDVPSEVL